MGCGASAARIVGAWSMVAASCSVGTAVPGGAAGGDGSIAGATGGATTARVAGSDIRCDPSCADVGCGMVVPLLRTRGAGGRGTGIGFATVVASATAGGDGTWG